MMNIVKSLPVIAVLILLKYVQIKLMKSRIHLYLDSMNAKNIIIKFKKMEDRYDLYHATYEVEGEYIEKHVICNLFSNMRWL